MDDFQKAVLRGLTALYDQSSEHQKSVGVTIRDLARALSDALGIEPSFVENTDYHNSEERRRLENNLENLRQADLITATFLIGGDGRISPTLRGREMTERWNAEDNSPIEQGKRLLQHLYEEQQDFDELDRTSGQATQIDVEHLCDKFGIDRSVYLRAANWAKRQEYLGEVMTNYRLIENGGIFITNDGMSAVENEFREARAPAGPTINIHNSRVYGDVLAAGRDAMVISNTNLAESAEEIRSLLAQVQEAIENLAVNDDERHDALQQLETLQRELAKPSPGVERAERSINVIGGIASISAAVGPHLGQLLNLLQQLSH